MEGEQGERKKERVEKKGGGGRERGSEKGAGVSQWWRMSLYFHMYVID
ncbi:MAG: hypothetical protein MJE68_21050 [Proteobacteria bacterium]|nr:hypothetical protein [Pseudomonadota bacterium]